MDIGSQTSRLVITHAIEPVNEASSEKPCAIVFALSGPLVKA